MYKSETHPVYQVYLFGIWKWFTYIVYFIFLFQLKKFNGIKWKKTSILIVINKRNEVGAIISNCYYRKMNLIPIEKLSSFIFSSPIFFSTSPPVGDIFFPKFKTRVVQLFLRELRGYWKFKFCSCHLFFLDWDNSIKWKK